MKDTNFYDSESKNYSAKRYAEKPISYTQYFFGRRLKLVSCAVGDILEKRGGATSLLEVGCADGVVVKDLCAKYGAKISSVVGIDISPKMIEVARTNVVDSRACFLERKDYQTSPKDMVIEVGVANYADIHEELAFAKANMKQDGVYILSLAGKYSLWSMRVGGKTGFNNFLSYKQYESLIKRDFKIIKTIPVGVFVPFIWKVPPVARIIQAMKEAISAKVFPNLCHEKIYILAKI